MSSWHRNEYLLKGLFLGMWAYYALQVPEDSSRAWIDIAWLLGWVVGGLVTGLIAGTALQVKRGLRPWQNWLAFPILVVLESPTFIYGGVIIGLVVATVSGQDFSAPWVERIASVFGITLEEIKNKLPANWLGYFAVGGMLLGLGLKRMREMDDRGWRFWVGFGVAAVMVYLASTYIAKVPGLEEPGARRTLGISLLFAAPFFYLLTFCGDAEESEVEVMALCSLLGVALSAMGFASTMPGIGPIAPYIIPVLLYFVYATRLMPSLRVFKHIIRGYSYLNLGRLQLAVLSFRRALELDPQSELATRGMQSLHNSLTLARLESEPNLGASLDFSLCLDRASSMLVAKPTPEKQLEAERFLELVEQKAPAYLANVDYLRVVSLLHSRRFDAAAETLSRLLNPETPGYHPVPRRQVLFDAWDLALRVHPAMVERLGWPETNKPGRRMEAIAVVERKLAAAPDDPTAQEFKTVLYSQLSESEFIAAISADGKAPGEFNYDYVEQLGLALVDSNDSEGRERGRDFLRIAGRGLPDRGPGIFMKLAQAYEKEGNPESMKRSLESVKQVSLAVGPRNLVREQKQFYFDALRKLADLADQRGDFETAIEELRQYQSDGGTAVLENYRRLAELYGKLHDAMNGLLMTETGLMYNSSDPDLLRKKESFYYSVEPERLEKVKDRVVKWFDVEYCLRKATSILNMKESGVELLDWATHLAALARVMKPESHAVSLVDARLKLRRGDRDAGLQVLEDIHFSKEKGSGEDEEAWYTATKLLGQIYLDELNKPDNALSCFQAYKNYHKSGADTLFQIARCYEGKGDSANAIRFYSAVTGYDGHPRYWDAKEAIRHLKGE